MKKSIYITLLVAAALVACKKDTSNPAPTTSQQLQAKWHYVSSVINNYYSGAPHMITLTGNATDYADFRNDGKLYSFTLGSYDTAAYAILSDSKLWIDTPQDEFEIRTLTGSDCVLYNKEVISATEFTETTVTLHK